jgi:D-galactose 1-dehydrogenase/L-arabinose 1- dehydrogenase
MAEPIALGIVGVGKIARDQHLPAIAADDRFRLAAAASRNAGVDGVPSYREIGEMIAATPGLQAVSICTPPAGRHAIAAAAIDAGLDVMLEKPPSAGLSEIADLAARAAAKGVVLFATWHSREAGGVAPAREWLASRRVLSATITWKEDIRRWHPGQEWILGPGGFGVFDPGINALSILTAILPEPPLLENATLDVPANRVSPIAAELTMRSGGALVAASLDFLQTGQQSWDIAVETDDGTLELAMGGSVLTLPGEPRREMPNEEYPRLYARFAGLVASRRSDVDVRPLQLVADAFLAGDRRTVEAFRF